MYNQLQGLELNIRKIYNYYYQNRIKTGAPCWRALYSSFTQLFLRRFL